MLRELERPVPADAFARLESLVSPFTGIVRTVEEVLAEPGDLPLPNLCCQTGHLAGLVGRETTHLGAGSGRSRGAARAAAIAEAVERYSACDSDGVDAVVAPAERLPRAVAPERFALFSETQHAGRTLPYARFDSATPVAWVEGRALPDDEPVLLPAQLVYLGWRLRPGEQPIARATSSGLACHAAPADALLAALLELVERDSFMITWKARLSFARLTWADGSPLATFERCYLRPTGLRVAAVDLSAFWEVPCVVAVARSRVTGEAPLGVGAAAAATVERAVEKACDEAVRVRSWAHTIRLADPESCPEPEQIREFEDHIRHYAYDEHTADADFLDGSSEIRDASEVAAVPGSSAAGTITALCERLARRGVTAYAVDVTAPDVRAAGLHVVRAVAPELCPLDVEQAARHFGGRRLYEEPARLGASARLLREEDLNPDPHPFP